jgi:uracil-DNA glycosylase family protein
MTKRPPTAEPFLPDRRSLRALDEAVHECRGCGLWQRATQAVFGEGPARAEVMMVGEQPGDREDVAGKPFVGPAGRVLDTALEDAGIERDRVYVTNAVKHFKWKARGKRRIHDKPSWTEIQACLPWLEAELEAVRPQVLVAMGATAAQALLGRDFRVTRDRGRPVPSPLAPNVLATIHPSAVLRAGEEADRREALESLTDDLRVVAGLLAGKDGVRPGSTPRARSG